MSKKRKVIIGSNPDAQLELHVEVDTGIVVDTKGGGDWNDAVRLAEIYTSITGKKARKKADAEDLFDLIFEHIEDLQAGYMKMVDSGPIAEPDPDEHDAEPEIIGRWTRTYKGATFALVQTSEGYVVEAPMTHPANGKTYDSPTAAATDITKYKSVSGRSWFGMDETTALPNKVSAGGDGAQYRYPPVRVEDPRLPIIGRVVKFQHKGVAYTLQRTTEGYAAEPTDGSGPCYLVGEADGLHGLATKISGQRLTLAQAFAFFNLDPKGDLHDPWLILGCLVRDGAIRAGDIEDSLNLLESEQATYAEVAQAANDLSRELYGRSILKKLGLDPAEVMAGKPS